MIALLGPPLPEGSGQNLAGSGGPLEAGDELAAGAPAVPLVPRVVAPRVCQVAFSGMPAAERARIDAHAWLERLGELTTSLTSGQVLIEAVNRGRRGRHYRVRMDLTFPTGVVAVDHDHPNNRPDEDIFVAIRNAFRAARRQLEAHRRTVSGARDEAALAHPLGHDPLLAAQDGLAGVE